MAIEIVENGTRGGLRLTFKDQGVVRKNHVGSIVDTVVAKIRGFVRSCYGCQNPPTDRRPLGSFPTSCTIY